MPVLQMISTLSCTLEGHQSGLQAYLKEFAGFSFLWQEDINSHYKKFLEKSPTLEVTHRLRLAFNVITQSEPQHVIHMLMWVCFVCHVLT